MRRFISACAAIFIVTLMLAPPAAAIGLGGWDHVGHGSTSTIASLNGAVYAMNTRKPGVLYVGGAFTSAGGNTHAQHIASWNGTSWSSLGTTPLNGAVNAIAYDTATGRVFAGGQFTNAGGHADADFLAVWNGSSWAPFCIPTIAGHAPITASVAALQIVGSNLYIGGSFANGAGIDAADYLVRCDLTTGVASATVDSTVHAFGGAVLALTADNNGTLYAGGQFLNLESIPAADHVAVFDGAVTWAAMGTGPNGTAVDSFVRSLTASGTNVYVGTDSVNVAGITNADHVVRWNGTSWSALGSNTAGTDGYFSTSNWYINALAVYGSTVVAAGYFQNANGVAAADDIAYYDGKSWRPIGSNGAGNGPFNSHPTALAITSGKVYAGGAFTSAGGDSLAKYLAAYALRQPDAWIGATSTGSFVGNNIYSASGAGEARSVTVTRGHSATSYIKIQNDGLVTASFHVEGPSGAQGFSVHYYRSTTNISSAVWGGTYVTGNIAARGSIMLRMVVAVATSSSSGAIFTVSVISSTGTPRDAVRFAVTATG